LLLASAACTAESDEQTESSEAAATATTLRALTAARQGTPVFNIHCFDDDGAFAFKIRGFFFGTKLYEDGNINLSPDQNGFTVRNGNLRLFDDRGDFLVVLPPFSEETTSQPSLGNTSLVFELENGKLGASGVYAGQPATFSDCRVFTKTVLNDGTNTPWRRVL
jgi:hypothetical protein